MRDPIVDLAQLPSCRMLLMPDAWLSPLVQDMVWPFPPRNFANNPATWGIIWAINDAACFEWDIYLRVNINAFGAVNQNIFFNGVGAFPIRISYTTGSQIAVTMVGFGQGITDYNHPGVWEFNLSSHSGMITVTYKRTGMSSFSTLFVRTVETALYWASPPTSNFDGTVEELSIKNNGTPVFNYPEYQLEKLRLIMTDGNAQNNGIVWMAANPSLGWSIKSAIPTGLTGTVLAKINGTVAVNPSKWNRSTSTFTGLATDTLEWLAVFDETLSAELITYASK